MGGEVKIPSEDDIRQLPRWARLAFAARCARRVLPLFQHSWPDAPAEYVQVLERAVAVAETSATTAWGDLFGIDYSTPVFAVCEASIDAVPQSRLLCVANVGLAARAALAAADEVRFAAFAAKAATDSAWGAGLKQSEMTPAIARDFQTLLARAELWTDYTPVPAEVFGPLWPNGVPEGWPVEYCSQA